MSAIARKTTHDRRNAGARARPDRAPQGENATRWSAERGDAWKLVLPALLPILIFSVVPLVRGIYLGFTDSKAGLNVTTTFNGLENYREIWHDDGFRESFWIGVKWMFYVTVLQFFASLGLALLLNLDLMLRGLARTLALVPWAMPPVIVAIMWSMMLRTHGRVRSTRSSGGRARRADQLARRRARRSGGVVVGVWAGMPQTTITLLAGLQSVPEELHEAAAIDGRPRSVVSATSRSPRCARSSWRSRRST